MRLNEDHKKLVLVQMFSFLSVLLLLLVVAAAAAVDKQSVRALRLTTSKASTLLSAAIVTLNFEYMLSMVRLFNMHGLFWFLLNGKPHTHTHTHTHEQNWNIKNTTSLISANQKKKKEKN